MDELQNPNCKIQNRSQEPNHKPQKVYDLRERLLLFAKRILQVCKTLPKVPECEGIRRQLARASTSVGANFEEADGSLTKKDFINKVGIARKEAKETRYWLRVIGNIYLEEKSISAETREAEEIISILSAILIKLGANNQR